MPDSIRLQELDDPGHLLGGSRLAGVKGQAQPELPRAAVEALVVGDAEGRRFGPGHVDPDHAAVPPGDRLLGNDLVELVWEGAVEAEDQARLDGIFEDGAVRS